MPDSYAWHRGSTVQGTQAARLHLSGNPAPTRRIDCQFSIHC